LQVPDDSQVIVFGDWIKSIDMLIDILHLASTSLPNGWHLRLKEHPSAKQRFTSKIQLLTSSKFHLDNTTNTFEQVEYSKSVLTINSSVGLQAMFFDRPVITLGKAFYSFDELTQRCSNIGELFSKLKAPDLLSFSQTQRDNFLSYLHKEYYPLENDVTAGLYTSYDVRRRDRRANKILANL
jgi:capsular polysaccharide export protein